MEEKIQIIVATIAFGMGINKRNVRFVINLSMPQSLDQYIQQLGRAGRDQEPAECITFYDPNDNRLYQWFINQINTDEHTDSVRK